jgi:hypothetical protein
MYEMFGFYVRRSVYFLNIRYIRVFYRLIEIRRYKLVSEPWSVLSGLVCVDFSCCMRMVMSYLRYLFCCADVLICWLVLCSLEMAGGRDDGVIAEALTAMAQVLSS